MASKTGWRPGARSSALWGGSTGWGTEQSSRGWMSGGPQQLQLQSSCTGTQGREPPPTASAPPGSVDF